ncbi:endonuclease/exonuclease/phosphatase family protein [Glaciecola sp. KUL10]|uniref:endonuclease/exonuclease/phosphatase family protein n=1 Tax=Glaciecola sp. (strain KUL10) TaxID=2161813 RepID=UPI000D78BF7B|nr:endonuclease/exonuclease/phosphatase family protein [Glaciecola sp. KUL10]
MNKALANVALKFCTLLFSILILLGCSLLPKGSPERAVSNTVKIASFNVSMEARNYSSADENQSAQQLSKGPVLLMKHLQSGNHQQIKNIAEIIQRIQPDIILLNEFDYIDNPKKGVEAFIKNYLNKSQNGAEAIDFPYYFYAQSNTGLPTTFDLDNNGKAEGFGADAHGFGLYHGHYGMVLLSKYPIVQKEIRTFQRFLWSDMPNALKPIDPETNLPFYDELEWANLRLSSKSHWDVPIKINNKTVHVLASHPTPPVFDGDEDRNGKRNHDEIRFWLDYVSPKQASYIYDDRCIKGGLNEKAEFVILGDLNASPDRIEDKQHALHQLITSKRVNESKIPASRAGRENRPDNVYADFHTASWAARVDYVMPSSGFEIIDNGVFWPTKNDDLHRLVKDRASSSDHFMVWQTLRF